MMAKLFKISTASVCHMIRTSRMG